MIVVVGSGIAGLSAALAITETVGEHGTASSETHPDVLLVTKGPILESNTLHAQGGIAVALFQDDNPSLHKADTLAAGAGLCDPTAVDVLTREGVQRVRELVEAGVHFDRQPDGNLSRGLEAAHGKARVIHAGGDATGKILEQDVAAMVLANPKVHVIEHAMLKDLIITDNRVAGVTLLIDTSAQPVAQQYPNSISDYVLNQASTASNHMVDVRAQAVILATGGSGQLYPYTTNPQIATGDGVAAAWRAGAQLADLEFYQFHPTALAVGEHFLISEAVRGEGAHLLDEQGVRYMLQVDKHAELAPRDVVARANFAVMQKQSGRPVYLDVSQISLPDSVMSDALSNARPTVRSSHKELLRAFLHRRFPTIDATTRSLGFDWCDQALPVAPAAHYSMGGICTDVFGRTSVPGLYAAGECARSGVHGANRLASNSLLEGLVFGHRAGVAAKNFINSPQAAIQVWQTQPQHAAHQRLRLLQIPSVNHPERGPHSADVANSDLPRFEASDTRESIQQELWNHVGVLRDRQGLTAAIAHLGSALAEAESVVANRDIRPQNLAADCAVQQLENRNLLTVGYLSAVAALQRQESRGAHARTDFPNRSEVGVSMRYAKYS
ncbi:MAG: FAD-dependent oxidoreductase [Bifidobacterium sp.]|jgi:L-aspartate oxidase|nr:FAD-dependent oxidoreductase [Bifidobacterium sp.]MCH4174840.1 FAD-dependent oxidoreductase [Bifidobacterium sp.]